MAAVTDTSLSPQPLKVFVGGVPEDISEPDLRGYFGRFGDIDTVRIMKKDGKSRNFVFVVFKEEEGIERCLKEEDHFLNGKSVSYVAPVHSSHTHFRSSVCVIQIEVQRAIQVGIIVTKGVDRRKVFIGGLQDQASRNDIEDALAKVGFDKDEIREIKIMTEKDTEKPRGFGFVTMRSNAAAVRLVKLGNLGIKVRCGQ